MALNQSALLELTEVLRSVDEGQLMRSLLHTILQALIDAEAEAHIGAGLHERSDGRVTQRNGTRAKMVSTAAGDLAVKIPKTRTGSFFPSLLHPRRRIDVALHAVVMEAYVHGVSTRKVDDLVSALGAESGISKSEVSRICGELDTEVAAFNGRDLAGQGVPVRVRRRHLLQGQRRRGQVWRRGSSVLAGGGHRHRGQRRWAPGGAGLRGRDSETEAFWTEFLRSLRERGLAGVALVISDHHRGLMNAINATMIGTAWQRCRVHYADIGIRCISCATC